jgi:mannose-6-phosphate isomerase-like protein (cupin superfamily)
MSWIDERNLAVRDRRDFGPFTLWSAIDGEIIPGREVTFAEVKGPCSGQHIHKRSDAFLIVCSGQGTLLMGEVQKPLSSGHLAEVPRGAAPGFRLHAGEGFLFVVPGVGIEPTRSCDHRILSPARLPVPPPGHGKQLSDTDTIRIIIGDFFAKINDSQYNSPIWPG